MRLSSEEIVIKLPGKEKIRSIQFVDKAVVNGLLIVTDQGVLYVYSLVNESLRFLLNVREWINTEKDISIYTYKYAAVVVNRKGLSGLVLDIRDGSVIMPLEREDYYAENCVFPIAFYSKEEEIFLIHGTAWNRLDITRLSDRILMTDREVRYDKKKSVNYLDYFHSSLCMSPDERHFISNGWAWSPVDIMLMWEVSAFLQNYEAAHHDIHELTTSGYNWDRPLCWIDADTIAWGFNALEDDELELSEDNRSELIIQHIGHKEIAERIPFDGFYLAADGEVMGTLTFDPKIDCFVSFHPKTGITITNRKGEVLVSEPGIDPFVYSAEYGAFLVLNGADEIRIIEIENL